ncbi:uncharacterized protein UTRI_03648_B [Ustilago trichophora]|uniref:XPG-I domain-containing protein n=1 Tax=Ustilago trichophora TaxID=86804 RepID=A0A5C3DZY5_9BASI|nr:uncharacterized protein UTRI_03648_B [Ustilago trichophora]
MGIPGLWAELAPAAQTTTLPSYCLTTFTENTNELRGLRLGIDASLWLFHAQQSSGGSNPYLRLLFYRLAKLLSLPVLPVFVFDGPSRPTWKRGKQVKGRQHAIEQPFTQLIEAFGYQWHRAPGEAEAELAYLNQTGWVDAVLTDDSDALLFGARMLVRNWGKNLSGTKALSRTTSASSDVFDETPSIPSAGPRLQLSGSDRDHLITLYKADDLVTLPQLGIDRDGLILIALMSGGDYDTTGLLQCGVKIALALARGGFGTTLIDAFKRSYPDQPSASQPCGTFTTFMQTWLEQVRDELRTNERGFLPNRRPKLASSIEQSFLSTADSRKVLAYYVYPLTSKGATVTLGKSAEPDLTRLARLSQIFFHWSRNAILSKVRTVLGPGVVIRRLRQEIVEYNDGAGEGPWAALVESPASKAVRRHMLGLESEATFSSAGATSKATTTTITTIAKTAKQKPLHESPNATRITDFFAKSTLNPAPTSTHQPAFDSSAAPPLMSTIEILAIKLQRRHIALAPFLDYRVLVSMDEFAKAAELGIDPSLEAELAADDEADTDAPLLEDDEDGEDSNQRRHRGVGSTTVEPGDPLLMWIPEPLLELSTSGADPLTSFLKEAERKATAAKTKSAKKAATNSSGTNARKGARQMTLNGFVKPLAKASLSGTMKVPKSLGGVSVAAEQPGMPASVQAQPRMPRQLRVPSGMRRTESVPVATAALGTTSLSSTRGFSRTTSLPSHEADLFRPCNGEEEDELDSSIEFLGAFTASHSNTAVVRARSSTPPPNSSLSEVRERPKKSPKKMLSSSSSWTTRSSSQSRSQGKIDATSLPSARALAELPLLSDQEDEDEEDGTGQGDTGMFLGSAMSLRKRLEEGQKRKPKPRVSTITISSNSSDGSP